VAVIQPTITPVLDHAGGVVPGAFIYSWFNVTAADTCAPARLPSHADKSIQAVFNSGTPTWGIEGSNDPTLANWADLNDPQGNALSAVATAKMEQLLENVAAVRPKTPAGTTPNVTFYLMAYAAARR